MPVVDALLPHAAPLVLVVARLGGLFVFAPVIASTAIPARIRALLLFMFAAAIYPTLPPEQQAPVNLDVFTLGAAVAGEALVGVVVGLLAIMPIISVQLGGMVMGQQMGLGLASIYDPSIDTESDAVGQLLLYVALAFFIAMGGLDAMFLAVATTFERVPLGAAAATLPPLDLLVGAVASGFDLALRVSAPVLCIVLLETVAMGFVSKTLPQLNVLSVGFAVKVVAGLTALLAGMAAIEHVLADEVGAACRAMLEWARSIGL